MKDPVIKGHPLHAILTDLPIGITVAAMAFDLIGLLRPDAVWHTGARILTLLALLFGVLAALAGLWDYQAIPRDHPARRTGALHGILNAVGLVLLLIGSVLWWATLFALAVFIVAGWFGGELVFAQGWRVTPAEWDEQLEQELRQHGETDPIHRAHATIERYREEQTLWP